MKSNKDDLEKFIEQNNLSFHQERPSSDLWDKINRELPTSGKVVKLNKLNIVLKMAAAIILVAGVGYALMQIVNTSVEVTPQNLSESKTFSLKDISSELGEVELYYQSEIDSKKTEINQLGLSEDVLEEVTSLDAEFNALRDEIYTSSNSEKVINAMIDNYRLQLDNLENILDHFNHLEKNEHHENNSDNIIVYV